MELRFKPDLEDALAHWRAFWNHDIIKRPCVAIRAPKDGVEWIPGTPSQFRPDVDLRKEVIEPVIEMCESDAVAKGMVLDRQVPKAVLRIECDPGLLRIAFGNLMTNAVKYGREGGRIRIEMTADNNQVRLTVWNEGIGFAERQRIKLFRKFVRLDDPELRKQKGTGVGLYSTWRIMQLHHGHVRANSQPGKWAEFTLMLPIRRRDEIDVD